MVIGCVLRTARVLLGPHGRAHWDQIRSLHYTSRTPETEAFLSTGVLYVQEVLPLLYKMGKDFLDRQFCVNVLWRDGLV